MASGIPTQKIIHDVRKNGVYCGVRQVFLPHDESELHFLPKQMSMAYRRSELHFPRSECPWRTEGVNPTPLRSECPWLTEGVSFTPLRSESPWHTEGVKATRMLRNFLTSRWKQSPLSLNSGTHAVRDSEDHYLLRQASLPYDESGLHSFS